MAATLVQTSGKIRTAGTGDVTITMPSNFTAGNTAIASGVKYEPSDITSLTLNGSTAVVLRSQVGGASSIWLRYVASLAGGTNGGTLDTPTGSDYNTFSVEEWSGLDTAALVDHNPAAASGNSTAPSIAVNPTAVGNVNYGVWGAEFGNSAIGITHPSGYTAAWSEPDSNTYQGGAGVYRTAASTGSQAITWTLANGGAWLAIGAVFKAATGGGGGVTVGATGVSSTAAVGSVSPSTSKALTGNSATGTAGTVRPGTSKALTGNAATVALGFVAPGLSKTLAGNAATASAGSVGVSVTVALTGVQGSGQVGNVTTGSDVVVALTGVAAAVLAGSVATSRTVPVTGTVAVAALGTVVAGTAKAVSGVSGAAQAGSVAAASSVALAGVSAASAVGSVGVVGDVTVALTGVHATAEVGNVAVQGAQRFGGFEIVDSPSPLWWKRRKTEPEAAEEEEAQPTLTVDAAQKALAIIEKAAQRHVDQRLPFKTRKSRLKLDLRPLLPELQGVDWVGMYRTMYSQALTEAIRREQFIEDEAVALLLLLH